MKLLFDENLSYRLIQRVEGTFPGSQHVDSVGLHAQADAAIWSFAQSNGFIIVSKDDDFRQLSFLHGAPPKVVWLSVGNATTEQIAGLLTESRSRLESLERSTEESLLILELPKGAA